MKTTQIATLEPQKTGRKVLEDEQDRVIAVRFYIQTKHVAALKKLVEPIIKDLKKK